MKKDAWKFADNLPGGEYRIPALTAAPLFGEICNRVADEMEILCCHEERCKANSSFSRVVFCICVSPPVFDLFFNSESGYRGAYFASAYRGLDANRAFIDRASGEFIEPHRAGVDPNFAAESLASPSSKVWLAEYGKQLCDRCVGEIGCPNDDNPEIRNGRWEHDSHPYARWGGKAPYLTKLRIFGAFLDESNNVFIAGDKRHRAVEIHKRGWA